MLCFCFEGTLESAEDKLEKNLVTSNVSDSSSDDQTPEKSKKRSHENSDDSDLDDTNNIKNPKLLPKSPFERRSRKKKLRISNSKSASESSVNTCEAGENT